MLVEAEIWSIARIGSENAVLIRPIGGELAVPIYIDQYQTQAILIGLGNVAMERPGTHDLLLSMLENLKVAIERVEITNLQDGMYFAQIIIQQHGKKITIDARPSDSLALAVRLKCPVFISETIVAEAGSEISSITNESDSEDIEEIKSEKIVLEEKLEKAISDENYEEAAVLRDKLKEIDNGPIAVD